MFKPVVAAFKELSTTNTKVYIQHGNRDFLLGKKFTQLTSTTLIEDPYRIEINGRAILLTHGDKLCTEDLFV